MGAEIKYTFRYEVPTELLNVLKKMNAVDALSTLNELLCERTFSVTPNRSFDCNKAMMPLPRLSKTISCEDILDVGSVIGIDTKRFAYTKPTNITLPYNKWFRVSVYLAKKHRQPLTDEFIKSLLTPIDSVFLKCYKYHQNIAMTMAEAEKSHVSTQIQAALTASENKGLTLSEVALSEGDYGNLDRSFLLQIIELSEI